MKKFSFFVTLVLFVVIIPLAQATVLVRLSLEQLSQAASEVVRGRVVGQESRWNESRTQIVTLTTIAVSEVVKGSPTSTLVVEQIGGTVGNIHVRVPGAARFRPQQEYLVFLEPVPDTSRFRPVGMGQGVYRIYCDPDTQIEKVVQPFGGTITAPAARAGRGRPIETTVPLGQFRQYLRQAVAAPLVVPKGTVLPLVIASSEFYGAGQMRVSARTRVDVYPNAAAIIPAGSEVEGTARLVAGKWLITWSGVTVRGQRVELRALSEEIGGTALRGRAVTIQVR